MARRATDPRVQRTRRLLRSALMSLIEERGFERLSVRDILARAEVGRATFYAHFDNKEDLLVSGLEDLKTALRSRAARGAGHRTGTHPFAFSRELFAHVESHRSMFAAMLGTASGTRVQHLFHKLLIDVIREELGPAARAETVQFVAGGLFGLCLWWATARSTVTLDGVDGEFRRLVTGAVSR